MKKGRVTLLIIAFIFKEISLLRGIIQHFLDHRGE